MNRQFLSRKIRLSGLVLGAGLCLALAGCGKTNTAKADSTDTGPAPAQVEPDFNVTNVKVDHPEQFPLVMAGSHMASQEVSVPGTVGPERLQAGSCHLDRNRKSHRHQSEGRRCSQQGTGLIHGA